MSAFIMLRLEDRIVLLTDGGTYRSRVDFTLCSLESKVLMLPHLGAAIVSCGNGRLSQLVYFNHGSYRQPGGRWETFDAMLKDFRVEVEAAATGLALDASGNWPHAIIGVAGWSDERQRFETYSIEAIDGEVGELLPAEQLLWVPHVNPDPMRNNGFDPEKVEIKNDRDDLGRLMQAIRETPRAMSLEEGDDAPPDVPRGSTVGGFMLRTVLTREGIDTHIMHRWPDMVGELIDPTQGKFIGSKGDKE